MVYCQCEDTFYKTYIEIKQINLCFEIELVGYIVSYAKTLTYEIIRMSSTEIKVLKVLLLRTRKSSQSL